MTNRMSYEEWDKVKKAMAVETFCIDICSNLMITHEDAKTIAMKRKELSDSNVCQCNQNVQEWRAIERNMENALIALQNLGYHIEPPD